MSNERSSDSRSVAANSTSGLTRNGSRNEDARIQEEDGGSTMTLQEIEDQRTKQAEREVRRASQEQQRRRQQQQQQQQGDEAAPSRSSSASHQSAEYRDRVSDFWQSQFDKASRRNMQQQSSMASRGDDPGGSERKGAKSGPITEKEMPISEFQGKVGAFASTSKIRKIDENDVGNGKTNPNVHVENSDDSKAFATTDAAGDVVLSFRSSKRNSDQQGEKPRESVTSMVSTTSSMPPAPTVLRRTTPVPTVHPGAVAVDGPGAASEELSTRSSAVAEVLASMGIDEASEMPDEDFEANTLITAESATFSPGEGGATIAHDDDIIADMVDDAEVIQYAEDVRFDFVKRHRCALLSAGIVAVAVIVILVVFVVKNKPQPICVRPGNDTRCWEIPFEEQSIPLQCSCYNHTMHALAARNFTSTHAKIYDHVLELMQSRHIIEPNWTIPIDTLTVLTTDYACDNEGMSSIDEEPSTDEATNIIELLDDKYSCDPTNQVLLEMSMMEYDQVGTLEEVESAPENLLIDLFVLKYIYVTMGGINWHQSSGWFKPGDVCDLHGLDCLFVSLFHRLTLPNNNLVGTIPDVISHLKSIRIIDLSNNEGITGTIPSFLAGMTSLNTIDLSGCSLSGSIPVHLGDLDDLTSLSLDHNYLTGSLPAELFFDWDHLESLNLNRNAFNGTIPSEISNAARLQSLRLQGNEFSGELPSQLQRLQRLELLNLGKNKFSGPIPTFLGWSMPSLELVSLYESGFTGDLPDKYCDIPLPTLPPQTNNTVPVENNEDPDNEAEDDVPPPARPERKVLVIGCNTTGFCECCEHRTTRIIPGDIHVECAEQLLDVGF